MQDARIAEIEQSLGPKIGWFFSLVSSNDAEDIGTIKGILNNLSFEKNSPEKKLACINHVDRVTGRTALISALWSADLTRFFIKECGADPNFKDTSGRTLLMHAASCGYLLTVEFLINDCSVDTKVVDNSGYSALMYAIENPNRRSVYYGDVRSVYYGGFSNVAGVGRYGIFMQGGGKRYEQQKTQQHSTIKYLVRRSSLDDLNKPNNSGYTPLMIAAQNGLSEIARLLLDKGVDIDQKNIEGKTALDIAQSKRKLVDWVDGDIISKGRPEISEMIQNHTPAKSKAPDDNSTQKSCGDSNPGEKGNHSKDSASVNKSENREIDRAEALSDNSAQKSGSDSNPSEKGNHSKGQGRGKNSNTSRGNSQKPYYYMTPYTYESCSQNKNPYGDDHQPQKYKGRGKNSNPSRGNPHGSGGHVTSYTSSRGNPHGSGDHLKSHTYESDSQNKDPYGDGSHYVFESSIPQGTKLHQSSAEGIGHGRGNSNNSHGNMH